MSRFFVLGVWAVAVLLVVSGAEAAKKKKPKKKRAPPAPKTCVIDADCDGRKLCLDSVCGFLPKGIALLEVMVEPPVEGALLSVDDGPPVSMPWSGSVNAGAHRLHVEAPGHVPLTLEGTIAPGRRQSLNLTLVPTPPPPPPPPPELPPTQPEGPLPQESEQDPHRRFLYAAGVFHGGAGVAIWGSLTVKTQVTLRGGLEVGVRILELPVGVELGAEASYGSFLIRDVPGASADFVSWNLLVLGLVPRLCFPLPNERLEAGFELEAAFAISTLNYLYFALRGHIGIKLRPWLGLRANLLGVDLLQDLGRKAAFVGYSGNLALVARFH